MRCVRLTDLQPGMTLARPARNDAGTPLLMAGVALDAPRVQMLRRVGIHEVWVVAAGEPLPDATVPEYMDRYGPDFPTRLQHIFSGSLVNRTMQHVFLEALAHAADCYRRYRVDGESS